MQMKFRKAAIAMGVLLGVTVPLGAMSLSSRNSEATILVYDQKNVEEAIKEAVQTAKILTEEQKQLALDILNTKSLDAKKLLAMVQSQQAAEKSLLSGDIMYPKEVLEKMGKLPSILNRNSTPTAIMENEIGTIESVYNGDATVVDLYQRTMKNRKALDATYKAAAESAKNIQTADAKLSTTVNTAVDAANSAEGQKQVLQAQTSILAAQALATHNGNEALTNLVAMVAEEAYARNYEKAMTEKMEQDSRDSMARFCGQ